MLELLKGKNILLRKYGKHQEAKESIKDEVIPFIKKMLQVLRNGGAGSEFITYFIS